MASTGSLGDYLGLPTTIFGSYGQGAMGFLNTGVLRCPGNKAGGDPNYTMFEYLPIQNSDQYYSFVSKYGATVDPDPGVDIAIPDPASASSSNFIEFGYSLTKPSVDIDDTFNASKRFCLKVSYDNLTNPTQSLIDAFVNKLTCFAVKADDSNIRFDLSVSSSLFNAKTNMVEVYFTLPEEFVKYASPIVTGKQIGRAHV